ncbi:large conductance mechanosensitive channel [Flavobacterium flevense]|uniref:Large-conductance mechanosensitive channel n=1 Tax=Flavobacterium flevense TaxID=983 RepID=A0A4Y4AZ09_9FLAO|nr:large-conductance mechanosensitive channel protein MscL [Flavobacterium flevense]GEC73418.1 large-conductance mechanosensitive channel [Flavobacterium flevense]SHL71618.1 large conductance mechanosensitive channel [Flavobacterium flevense]
MGFFSDFKAFLMKGEIVTLATAVIVGGAFGKIVTSFTNDVLMPPIGLLLGKVDFKNLKVVLQEGIPAVVENGAEIAPAVAEVSINYGAFIQTVFDFVIIGFCIFMVLKAYEKTKKKEEAVAAAPAGPTQEELLMQIRDLLKEKK